MSERFTVETMTSGEIVIWDDDFGWDATIKIVGDFYGPDRLFFAKAICAALNVAKLPTRQEWENAFPEEAQQLMHPTKTFDNVEDLIKALEKGCE